MKLTLETRHKECPCDNFFFSLVEQEIFEWRQHERCCFLDRLIRRLYLIM